MEICPYSGLPFACALCPEYDAPCYEKIKLRSKDFSNLSNCSDLDKLSSDNSDEVFNA